MVCLVDLVHLVCFVDFVYFVDLVDLVQAFNVWLRHEEFPLQFQKRKRPFSCLGDNINEGSVVSADISNWLSVISNH